MSSPVGREILLGLRQSVDEMDSSFESIMDLSKLEAGAVQVNVQPLALAELFGKLQREYVVQAQARHIDLSVGYTSCPVNFRYRDRMLIPAMAAARSLSPWQ